jgi:hypothetical protein
MSVADKSTQSFELERLQRWMQAVITHPLGVGTGIASGEARRSINVELDTLETVVSPSRTLSGAERLAIYCRSYHARLLECFETMFPALLHALGHELFNQFALDYLQHHPPRSYTLDHLADAFAQHLAETRPDRDAPPDKRESWPDFIIELALLELAFLKIYDGPGVEGRTLPRMPDILSLAPELILDAHLKPVPCLQLFAFRYPVHTYMLAARQDKQPEPPAPLESFVAVTRWNYRVRLYELSAPQYDFLRLLDAQHTVRQAINQGDDKQPTLTTIRNWLCDWVTKGFFESVAVTNDARAAYGDIV